MKSKHQTSMATSARKALIAVLLVTSTDSVVRAGDAKVVAPVTEPIAAQTNKDIPSDFHKYFGQRINSWRDRERQIAKIDLDSDLNHDGVLSNTDPADNGAFEATPPGQILGVGELTRVVIRLNPYRVDFDGEVVVTLEVEGINRGNKTGEFGSLDEEIASVSHIRVWRDQTKKQLLLDSANPAKRTVEFTTQYKTYPYNLPLTVPRFVFVEGVKASQNFIGDTRLLVTVSHRGPGGIQQVAEIQDKSPKSAEPVSPQPATVNFKSFRTSFDHILFTVQSEPAQKEFINNNNEGVWVAPKGKSY